MKNSTFLLLLTLYLQSCSDPVTANDEQPKVVTVTEVFHTDRDEGDNVDSPAIWHGPNGQHWLLATAKEGNTILAFDASNGDFIQRFGDGGSGVGQFLRPNGISVIDDLMLVVERDNQRISVYSLPEFSFVGFMTHEDLRLPYGLAANRNADGSYELYVTDNFNPSLEGYPPEEELDERVHHFRFHITNNMLSSEHVGTFGEIGGPGLLTKVESIYFDPVHARVLIADEAFSQRNVKVYSPDGTFTGDIIPDTYFSSEPEGIALYSCDNGEGYWIITDQHRTPENKFEIFDRITLSHLGTVKTQMTLNTDGIWLTQRAFGPFAKGALYPVHDDGSITAISWADIASGLDLTLDCTQ